MTQFQVGDRVKLVEEHGAWCNGNLGKEGTVIRVPNEERGWMYVKFDNSIGEAFETDWGSPDYLKLVSTSTTPPETIQHEGYNYTRGEPVVPEWVKDGAWVVNICSGELRKVKEVKPGVFDLVVNDLVSIRYQDAIRDQYRPFTNADWKWGMWAEYKGEKVFVCSGKLPFDLIRIGANPDGKIHTTLGSNGYVNINQLTPTTAP